VVAAVGGKPAVGGGMGEVARVGWRRRLKQVRWPLKLAVATVGEVGVGSSERSGGVGVGGGVGGGAVVVEGRLASEDERRRRARGGGVDHGGVADRVGPVVRRCRVVRLVAYRQRQRRRRRRRRRP